jgi:hypothetical protein
MNEESGDQFAKNDQNVTNLYASYFFDANILCKHEPTIQYIDQSQSFYYIAINYQSTYV